MNKEFSLTVGQVAQIVGCHRNSVKNFAERGVILSAKDHNGWLRVPVSEAVRLRRLLNQRTPVKTGNETA